MHRDEAVDLASGVADLAVRYGAGPFSGAGIRTALPGAFRCRLQPPRSASATPRDLTTARLIHSEWLRRDLQPDWPRWQALAGVTGAERRGWRALHRRKPRDPGGGGRAGRRHHEPVPGRGRTRARRARAPRSVRSSKGITIIWSRRRRTWPAPMFRLSGNGSRPWHRGDMPAPRRCVRGGWFKTLHPRRTACMSPVQTFPSYRARSEGAANGSRHR
jgi:hypothetical protein